ncbi:indole-3-glycerol phosphate synthase TrpC [Gleimia sp. 6138-11-ORH1]|uniref:indole-3-glycerol phosphate synthase TrpC n=1 Tax=Gleimia sp. 6138-11-ORH1 TaxID=2973937 RepID=UPI002168369F|nr:indole-3-glycerol phosphate synthase TrpC [Gleimia sp. 6138-11-ORH1]MCS4484289.1 indole-3-glycerol phosphate synthase TrpC [Gleimia sp. 6138-11-ORH1]
MGILEKIVASVKSEVNGREQHISLEEIRKMANQAPAPRLASYAIMQRPGALCIIGEIKRSTPLCESFRDNPQIGQIAADYEAGGAALISCVTEKQYFGGKLEDLRTVRKFSNLPILQTDFIISPYQILESRAYGADMLLLRTGLLTDEQLKNFIDRTESLGMSALVEVESRLEVLKAVEAGAKLISVNARSLKTQELDCAKVGEIFDIVPEEVVAIAAAGVHGPKEVFEYAKMGADAVMVGETLLRSDDIIRRLQELVAAGHHPSLLTDRKQRVKMHVLRTQHEFYRN